MVSTCNLIKGKKLRGLVDGSRPLGNVFFKRNQQQQQLMTKTRLLDDTHFPSCCPAGLVVKARNSRFWQVGSRLLSDLCF